LNQRLQAKRTLGIFAVVLTALVAVLTIAVAFVLNHGSGPIPVHYHASGAFARNAEYPTTKHGTSTAERWASWNGSDAKAGTLTSTPFRAPLAIALLVAGGTGRNNQHIEIVGPDGKSALSITNRDDAGEGYVQVKRFLPIAWYHRQVTLRAVDGGGGFRGWIGLADLRAANAMDMLLVPIAWLDDNGWIYVFVILLCMSALIVNAMLLPGARQAWGRVDTLFVYLVAATFFWLRWPVNIENVALNPDEGQTTAQAIKALHDFVPWNGFDPTTSGPLNSYVLDLPGLIGIVPTLVSTHIVGTLLVTFTAIAVFGAARVLWGSRVASCSALAYVAVEALTREADFIHTSSELLPTALLAAELWVFAILYSRPTRTRSIVAAAAIGLLAGAMPFAKLQATPTALIVSIAVLLVLYRSRLWSAIGAFCIGVTVMPFLLLGTAAITGGIQDVYVSYVLANLSYAGAATGSLFDWVPYIFDASPRFGTFLRGALLIVVILTGWISANRMRPARAAVAPVGFSALLVVVTAWEAIAPHRFFPHYLSLLTVPVSFFVAAIVALAATPPEPRLWSQKRAELIAIGFAGCIFFLAPAVQSVLNFGRPLYGVVAAASYQDPAATEMLRHVHPGQRVVVWGWEPALYAYSGTVMATRDCCSLLVTAPGKFRSYYRIRFLSDFNAHRPALVVDAVAPGSFFLANRATHGIETFPKLFAIIRRDYVLASDHNGVRFWISRAAERK
jgi:hypothetical protein